MEMRYKLYRTMTMSRSTFFQAQTWCNLARGMNRGFLDEPSPSFSLTPFLSFQHYIWRLSFPSPPFPSLPPIPSLPFPSLPFPFLPFPFSQGMRSKDYRLKTFFPGMYRVDIMQIGGFWVSLDNCTILQMDHTRFLNAPHGGQSIVLLVERLDFRW